MPLARWIVTLSLLAIAPQGALADSRGPTAKSQRNPPQSDKAETPQTTREIVLDERATGKVFGIRTARNVITTVEFPEDLIDRPTCGDCEEGQGAEGEALYKLQVSGPGRYLTIRPNPAARIPKDGDMATTMLVRMEHTTLTLYVEQGERSRADTRVVFTYPNRPAETEYLRTERAKLEAEIGAKVEAGVTARFLRAFAEPHSCESKSSRVRNGDLVLEAREMCYFGRDVVISFSIENRARAPLEVGSVVVNKGTDKREYLSQKTIDGDEPSTAVVILHLADGEQVKGPYEITVSERGGKERVVSLSRLEF